MHTSETQMGLDHRSNPLGRWNLWINRVGIYGVVIVLIVLGMLLSNKFLSINNFINIVQAVSLLGIVAVGVSFITYSGHFTDMSVPSIMAFSGIIAVASLQYGIVVSIVLGLLAGLLIGAVNGFVVGKLRANPIIWTLAVSFVMSGFMRWVFGGNQIYPDVKGGEASKVFIQLVRINLFGSFPLLIVIFLLLFISGYLILTKTKFGQQLKLIGSSYEVAKMTGVNVNRVLMIAFLLSAFCSSIGGILLTSLVKIGVFYNGTGYDFNATTAVVIGGMTLAGGRGSMFGVMGGALVIGFMNNIMALLGIGSFVQTIVSGIIFIIVVGIQAKSLRKLGRDYA